MLDLESVARVGLTEAASREAARDVVVGDPYLVITIAQVHGVDEVQLRSDVFAYRQTCRWLCFSRQLDWARSEPDLTRARGQLPH